MARLIDDLLDVSRISQGKISLHLQRSLLSDLVNAAIETTRVAIAEHSQVLQIALPQEPVWLDVDPARFEQILTNLLGNASKYSGARAEIGLTATLEGRELVLEVRDQGIGISTEMLPHVFDLFTQDERSVQ